MGYGLTYCCCDHVNKLLTNGLDGYGLAIAEVDGRYQDILWSSFDLGLAATAKEVTYGLDGTIYAAMRTGGAGIPLGRVIKIANDRKSIEWFVGVGAAEQSALDYAESIAVTRDNRVIAAVFDSHDISGEGFNVVVSYTPDGEVEWKHTFDEFIGSFNSYSFFPFCVRALYDGSVWVIGPNRIVKFSPSGDIEVNLTDPVERRATGAFYYGCGDVGPAPDNLLAVVLHEIGGQSGFDRHSLLFIDKDGNSQGLVTLSDSNAPTYVESNAYVQLRPRCVTATRSDYLVCFPIIGRATPDGLTWSNAIPSAFNTPAYGAAIAEPSSKFLIASEYDGQSPNAYNYSLRASGRKATDGTFYGLTATGAPYGQNSRNSIESGPRVGLLKNS